MNAHSRHEHGGPARLVRFALALLGFLSPILAPLLVLEILDGADPDVKIALMLVAAALGGWVSYKIVFTIPRER